MHPDFFGHHEKERDVNESNIKRLSEALSSSFGSVSSGGNEQSSLRTLTFYMKPQDQESEPHRIRIAMGSIGRLVESICNVLESIGAELPERPAGIGTGMRSSDDLSNTNKLIRLPTSCTASCILNFIFSFSF